MTRKLAIYLASLFVLTMGIYLTVHAYVYHQPPRIRWKTVTVHDPPPPPKLSVEGMVKQPLIQGSGQVISSPKGGLLAIVNGDALTIVNAKTGAVVHRTVSSHKIVNVTWIRDRLLFYVTSANQVATFDVLADRIRLIYTCSPPAGETIRTIAFSAYTNDVFVIFSGASGNTVYQFDTNEHVWARNLESLSIVRAYYGTTNEILYIEDANHTLYELKNGYIVKWVSHGAILRGAGNSLFYATLNQQGLVTAVREYDGSSKTRTVCQFTSPALLADVVVDHAGKVFLVHNDNIENVIARRTWAVPSGYKLRLVGHAVLLVRDDKYRVVIN